jgi:hypothetical protein
MHQALQPPAAPGITVEAIFDYIPPPPPAPGGAAPPPPVLQYPARFPSPQAFLAWHDEENRRLRDMMEEDLERMRWDRLAHTPKRRLERDYVYDILVSHPTVTAASVRALADSHFTAENATEEAFRVFRNDATGVLSPRRWWTNPADRKHKSPSLFR